MSKKLITVIIGQDCENTIDMCIESVIDSDEIIYLDGGSKDNTLGIINSFNKKSNIEVIHNKFVKENPNMISIQRNFYLDYLKQNYNKNDWILVLDADEVLDTKGIKKIKEQISLSANVICPRMRHLMYTLGFEDATQDKHYVLHRLFKLDNAINYPMNEHTVLSIKNTSVTNDNILIWHLGYIGGVWDIKKRFEQQTIRDNGYDKQFLVEWNKKHLLGNYPIRKICTDDLPDIILRKFNLTEEQVYFDNRSDLELKHSIFVKQWNSLLKPKSVADIGCAKGLYLYYWEMSCKCDGYEFSQYAIDNKLCDSNIYQLDLNEKDIKLNKKYDLIVANDVLEHLEYDTIDNTIDLLVDNSNKYILTSIPYKGTQNFYLDKTHIIEETKEWWANKFIERGCKEIKVPNNWIYKEQLMIFRK